MSRRILRLISSIRARRVSMDGGSGRDFLAARDDIEPEWLPVATRSTALFNGSLHKDHSELIVGHVAGVAEREVRLDKSAGAGELPLAAIDAPHDGARLQLRVCTIAEIPMLNCAELQTIVVAESDTALLQKCGLPRDRHLRLELGLAAGRRLGAPVDALCTNLSRDCCARRTGRRLHHIRRATRDRLSLELHRVEYLLHWHSPRGFFASPF